MPLIIANLLSFQSMFILGLVGLLLFGKDLPLMIRKAATEYYRYKKLISEATSDIRRELDSAATQIENEKRKIQDEVDKLKHDDLDDKDKMEAKDPYDATIGDTGYGGGDIPAPTHPHSIEAPAKPAADPLSLDVPSPSSLSHRATDPVKSAAAQAAALDTYQKGVPPPTKIPPPL